MLHSIGLLAVFTAIVCYVLVVLGIYQHKQTLLLIVCIVGFFFPPVGIIVAFVYGWMQAKSWRILGIQLLNIMYVFSGALLVMFFLGRHLLEMVPWPGRT